LAAPSAIYRSVWNSTEYELDVAATQVNADSGGLSGGISVSSAATYPDGKLCRNFRYSARRGTDEWVSDAILACSGDGVTWTYDASPK